MGNLPAPPSDQSPAVERQTNQLAKMAFVFLVGVAATATALTLSNRIRPAPIEIVPPPPSPSAVPTATPGLIRVYVSGQVASPAVYKLSPDSILQEAIVAAGGFTSMANTASINLAQPLVDGVQVYIPSLNESAATPGTVVLTPVPSSAERDPTTMNVLININTATQAELEMLPGIGPTLAGRIILYRESHGPFRQIQEIMDVEGIGAGRFAQIQELITLGPDAGSLR